jgi:hypothetical protein
MKKCTPALLHLETICARKGTATTSGHSMLDVRREKYLEMKERIKHITEAIANELDNIEQTFAAEDDDDSDRHWQLKNDQDKAKAHDISVLAQTYTSDAVHNSSARAVSKSRSNAYYPVPRSPTLYSKVAPSVSKLRLTKSFKQEQQKNIQITQSKNQNYIRHRTTLSKRMHFGQLMNQLRHAIIDHYCTRMFSQFRGTNETVLLQASLSYFMDECHRCSSNHTHLTRIEFAALLLAQPSAMATDPLVLDTVPYLGSKKDIQCLFNVLSTTEQEPSFISIAEFSLVLRTKWIPTSHVLCLLCPLHPTVQQGGTLPTTLLSTAATAAARRQAITRKNKESSNRVKRASLVFRAYSSPKGMSLLEWFSFVRDSRILDNCLSFDAVLSMYNEIIAETETNGSHRRPDSTATTTTTTTTSSSTPSYYFASDDQDEPAQEDCINETTWFRLCHRLMMCKMYKTVSIAECNDGAHTGPGTANATNHGNTAVPSVMKEDMSIFLDAMYVRPLELLVQQNVTRPRWLNRWLGSMHVMTEVACGAYTELYKAAFMVIALIESEQYCKQYCGARDEATKKDQKQIEVGEGKRKETMKEDEMDKKTVFYETGRRFANATWTQQYHMVWDWDVHISFGSVIDFLETLQLIGRTGLSRLEMEKHLQQRVQCHTTMHGTALNNVLFPEFCEILICLGSLMLDASSVENDRGGAGGAGGAGGGRQRHSRGISILSGAMSHASVSPNVHGDGIALYAKLEQIATYINGDVVLMEGNDKNEKNKTLTNRIRDQMYLMKRDRVSYESLIR